MVETENKHKGNSWLNKEFDLNLMRNVLKRNFYVPLLLLIIGVGGSFIYLRYTKPVFKSTAIIQRSSEDEGKRILDIEGFEKESNLSEDIELLKSTFLLDKALRNLNLEVSYFAEGDILTEEKYLLSSYHITLMELKDSSLVGSPIFVSKGGEGIILSFVANGENQQVSILPDVPVDNDFFNLVFKINDQELFSRNIEENSLYFVFNNYEALTTSLHGSLEVFALNPEAKTIQISFESNNHRLSKDIVTSVITTFFKYDLDKKRESSASILDFIDSQLDTVFTQLKESEMAIQSFKDSSDVNDPEFFTTKIMERSNQLQNQLLEVEMELDLIVEVQQTVNMSDRIEIFKIIPAVTGTKYESLLEKELEKLHELLVEKEDLSYSVTSDNETLKRVERSILAQTENVNRIIASVKNQLKFRRNNIQNRITKIQNELYGIPEKEMELSRLNRMFNLNEKYYSLLIEKKTQYAISKAGFTMDNMVLQAPSEAVLISPNRNLVYTLAVVLTLLISLIYLLIRYLTFNDIHEPEELKRLLPSTVGFLGIIPKVVTQEKNSTLIVHKKPKSALAESYRHIRSNLQFILKSGQSNLIAVSSSVSGEGKTFAAVNLAGIMAMSGKKVLVIDLDLRKPKIHDAFSVANEKGMSTLLVGASEWKDCVKKSELDGLDFITAGPIPPNPSELILGDLFSQIIEEIKKEYDIVMIDNPPVGIVSDGVSVMSKADCPIYVFRANYSKRYYTQRVRELVENNKVSKLFVVLNGMELGKRGYGYGYGYGEYYSDEVPEKKRWKFWKK
ncbi:MAG: polysaccharide biosynthesis tyrosine autokinase [Crocinitomicaceae bacterium]